MKIILEGPDNAGKTTFADSIKLLLTQEVHYAHPGGAPKDVTDEIWHLDDQLCTAKDAGDVIFDRVTSISQAIFNPAQTMMQDSVRSTYLAQMLKSGCMVIYFRPSTDFLMRTDQFTWREGESEEHKQKIIQNQMTFIERYDLMMAKIPNIIYNFEETEQADLILHGVASAFSGDVDAMNWLKSFLK